MSEMELALKLEGHDHQIGSLKHRIEELESQSLAIQELAISANRMTVVIENMLEELNQQGKRLERIERGPIETMTLIKVTIITTLVGGIVGAVVTTILSLV
ncbi:MAG: hypothetical protein IJP31_06485 [Lachnospiraceae bacterium]|nr:hypothetical protein [Lachnospiraceae bacterium]